MELEAYDLSSWITWYQPSRLSTYCLPVCPSSSGIGAIFMFIILDTYRFFLLLNPNQMEVLLTP